MMIKGRMMMGDQPILLLGLSRENCRRLLDDKPIRISSADLAEIGLPTDMEVIIIAGETEASISQSLGGMPLQPEVKGQKLWMKPK
jgi:hypothetical protein